jgi:hypothetical protein
MGLEEAETLTKISGLGEIDELGVVVVEGGTSSF